MNNRSKDIYPHRDGFICKNCQDQIPKPSPFSSNQCELDCFINFQQIKIKMSEKQGLDKQNSLTSTCSESSSRSKKDVGISAKLGNPTDDLLNNNVDRGFRLPNILKKNFSRDVKRLEDVQVTERVYNIMTNNRVMSKIRPMRLEDPDWTIAFIETYLGGVKRTSGWFPSRRIRC